MIRDALSPGVVAALIPIAALKLLKGFLGPSAAEDRQAGGSGRAG